MDVPLDQPIFTLWDAHNAPVPEDPHWVPAYEIHALGMEAYREAEGLPRFSEWTEVAMVMSTAEMPTVAVKTSEGPFPLDGLQGDRGGSSHRVRRPDHAPRHDEQRRREDPSRGGGR